LFGPSPDDASLLPAPDRFQITRAALSADGQRLATAREGSVDIWDVTGKRQLETIAKQSTRANPIVFFPNRSVLLSADEFGRLAAVPLGSSAAEPPLLMDTKYAANVAVSASGRFYATSQGSTTTVWDAETGLVRHDLAGSHPAFLDIDTSILTFEDDKVLVYDLRLDALTDAATHRAPIIAVTKRDQQ
jgi:WD40 repeat protein